MVNIGLQLHREHGFGHDIKLNTVTIVEYCQGKAEHEREIMDVH